MKAEVFCLLNACGAEGIRTPDPHTAGAYPELLLSIAVVLAAQSRLDTPTWRSDGKSTPTRSRTRLHMRVGNGVWHRALQVCAAVTRADRPRRAFRSAARG